MARPAKFKREDAVETAMNAFWRDGFEPNSVKALSERLGMTRSSFYNAFGSREALYLEALELYASRTPDQPLAKAEPGVPVKALITATFRDICRVRAGDPECRGCMAVNGVAELCNTHDELGSVIADAILGSVSRISTILEWGVARGEVPEDTDIPALALTLQNLIIGLNVLCKIVPDEDRLWSVAQTTLRGLDLYEEDGQAPGVQSE